MTMSALPPSFGKYQIQEPLGRGGFATVYRAYDASLDRDIALKILALHLAWEPDTVARFKQEARTAARLKHPNIVAIHEIGEEDGRIFIAMELISGESLRESLQRTGRLSIDEAVAILSPLADALDYAHSQGVIHRDVKPANILLETTHHGGTRPVLSDFGLVKSLAQSTEITQSGAVLGTVEYMAPEQADSERSKEIGPATDLYALGIVAYHMLTGQVPFSGSSAQILVSHLTRQPPSPHSLRADLPEALSAVILQALAKRPADRFASAAAFVQALRKAASPDQTAGPAPLPKRRRPWWPVIALVLLVAISVAGYGLWRRGQDSPAVAPPTDTATLAPGLAPTLTATSLPEASCIVLQDGRSLHAGPGFDQRSLGVLRQGEILRPLAGVPDVPPNFWVEVETASGRTGYVNANERTLDCNIDVWYLPPGALPLLTPEALPTPTPDLPPTAELETVQGPTPSPEQAPTKAPDANLSATASVPVCRVLVDGLRLRPGPGTVFEPPITVLPAGAELTPLGIIGSGFPSGAWLQVEMDNGRQGWVSAAANWIECSLELVSLPVVAPPPTPTRRPAPTATPPPSPVPTLAPTLVPTAEAPLATPEPAATNTPIPPDTATPKPTPIAPDTPAPALTPTP